MTITTSLLLCLCRWCQTAHWVLIGHPAGKKRKEKKRKIALFQSHYINIVLVTVGRTTHLGLCPCERVLGFLKNALEHPACFLEEQLHVNDFRTTSMTVIEKKKKNDFPEARILSVPLTAASHCSAFCWIADTSSFTACFQQNPSNTNHTAVNDTTGDTTSKWHQAIMAGDEEGHGAAVNFACSCVEYCGYGIFWVFCLSSNTSAKCNFSDLYDLMNIVPVFERLSFKPSPKGTDDGAETHFSRRGVFIQAAVAPSEVVH